MRALIYEHYFIVGRIYPYLKRQLKEEKAQVDPALLETEATLPSLPMIEEKRLCPALYLDLLQVNKFVYAEATHVVYERNIVVLPCAPLAARFFQNCLDSAKKRLWLKNVEIEFSVMDMSLDEKKDWFRSKGLNLPYGGYMHSMMSWTYEGHDNEKLEDERVDDWKRHLAEVVWPRKLAPILEDTKLNSLRVEFSNSWWCPPGFLYLHAKACAAFRKGFAHGMVKHLSLHNLPPWNPCDQEALEEGDRDDLEITDLMLPVVSYEGDDEDGRRYVQQAGEQIARWTKARELGLERGTRKWFREAEEWEEEGKTGLYDDYEPGD